MIVLRDVTDNWSWYLHKNLRRHVLWKLHPLRQQYGGMVRWLKKSSRDVNNTWQHMHLILRWLKIRTIHFSLISASKYWSRVFWSKWLTFSKFESLLPRIQFFFLSHLTILSARNHPKRRDREFCRRIIHNFNLGG